MLATIDRSSLDDLFSQIPAGVRLDQPLAIPAGVSEMELVADMRALAARNRHADELGQTTHRADEDRWPANR